MQNVSYITCVPLAVCDISFLFFSSSHNGMPFYVYLVFVFVLSCTASIIWQKTFQTIRKHVGANQGFLCGHAEFL